MNTEVNSIEEVNVVDPVVETGAYTPPKNVPYKKIFNDEGELANPITKGDPYNTTFMNRRQKKAMFKDMMKNPKNNKSGTRLVITKTGNSSFTKTHVTKQHIEAADKFIKVRTDEDGIEELKHVKHGARTLTHNVVK